MTRKKTYLFLFLMVLVLVVFLVIKSGLISIRTMEKELIVPKTIDVSVEYSPQQKTELIIVLFEHGSGCGRSSNKVDSSFTNGVLEIEVNGYFKWSSGAQYCTQALVPIYESIEIKESWFKDTDQVNITIELAGQKNYISLRSLEEGNFITLEPVREPINITISDTVVVKQPKDIVEIYSTELYTSRKYTPQQKREAVQNFALQKGLTNAKDKYPWLPSYYDSVGGSSLWVIKDYIFFPPGYNPTDRNVGNPKLGTIELGEDLFEVYINK